MSEGVFSRRMIFCDNLLTKYKAADLYKTCNCCKLFVCICCADSSKPKLCHHYPVVFIDGACSRNGSDGAFSGIGGLFGEEPAYQWSLPVDGIDPVLVRTSQRAELLAAITGVDRLGEYLLDQRSNDSIWKPAHNGSLAEMVVATDSEYVCKGVTEWMPKWKTNGWHTSSGKIVSNKDLFCILDEAISSLENRNINVGFWWIERQYNARADSLAKAACSKGGEHINASTP